MTGVARLAVLASGSGTNLQAVLDACARRALAAQVVGVYSDRADAGALDRARAAHVATVRHVPRLPGAPRPDYDRTLADAVTEVDPDWIVLAGFMRILGSAFLDRFPGRVVNLHPALPGELPGMHAIERAHEEARLGVRTRSGVMIHLVPDEGVDDGPVLATAEVPVGPDDSLTDFVDRMHACEHALLVSTLARLVEEISA
jgi:phosphoribosylglycinamide formyltransferase 1